MLLPWYRRGGAKRRGGRSHTINRSAFRSIICERPPRPLLSVADTPPVPGGELCSPKHVSLITQTAPKSRELEECRRYAAEKPLPCLKNSVITLPAHETPGPTYGG